MGKVTGFIEPGPKRWRHSAVPAVLLAAAASLAAAPAIADAAPAGVWVELHFSRMSGETKTIVEPVSLRSAGQANGYCNTELPAEHDIAHGAFLAHPELAGMTFVGANCQKDKSGQIKIANGAWPAGQGPTLTPVEQRNAAAANAYIAAHPVDPYAGVARNSPQPAGVALTYKLITGATATFTLAATKGNQAIDMSNCSARLKQGLLTRLEYEVRRSNKYPGGTLLSATCTPLPANITAAR